jgi:hypothetical protein
MLYKLIIHTPWHYKPHDLMHTGTYRVPENISEELAERAVKEGFATVERLETPSVKKPLNNKASGLSPNTKSS